ncbi:MAG: hypothetical protein ACREJQ_06345, partial [bacterium]
MGWDYELTSAWSVATFVLFLLLILGSILALWLIGGTEALQLTFPFIRPSREFRVWSRDIRQR